MSNKDKELEPDDSMQTFDLPQTGLRDVKVNILDQAPTPPPERRVGPHHVFPPVPKKKDDDIEYTAPPPSEIGLDE